MQYQPRLGQFKYQPRYFYTVIVMHVHLLLIIKKVETKSHFGALLAPLKNLGAEPAAIEGNSSFGA